jgi:hypothetical protein
MFTLRLISDGCWKFSGLCPGSMTTTFPLSGPEAGAGAEVEDAVGVRAVLGFLPSSVGAPDAEGAEGGEDRTVA